MSWQTLDIVIPPLAFFYGVLMVFVIGNGPLMRLAETRYPTMAAQFKVHQPLAWFCLWAGGLWSFQNLL